MARAQKVVTNPVLPEHRVKFLARLQHWQRKFGLIDWRIALSDRPPQTRGAMGETNKVDMSQRSAQFRISDDFGEQAVTDEEIDALARHEMAHLWLWELVLAATEGAPLDKVMSLEHRVINTLDHWVIQ